MFLFCGVIPHREGAGAWQKEEKKETKEEMFKVFGEFDSSKEINMTAEGLLNEGDKDNLYVLAQENGLDKEDVDDFIDAGREFVLFFFKSRKAEHRKEICR